MRIVLDLESNGLDDATTIHCIVTKDIDTDEVQVFDGRNMQESFRMFAPKITQVIAHNGIAFDCPTIERLLGIRIDPSLVFDTLVSSRLLHVGREGGHSLEAWGETLKFSKGGYSGDFQTYTQEMLDYCVRDVHLTHKVYEYQQAIFKRTKGAFDKSLAVEFEMQRICTDMHRNGFQFDIKRATSLSLSLTKQLEELDRQIQIACPPIVKRTQLKTKVKEEVIPFNPGSPKQMVDRLWEFGWKPVNKTKSHLEAIKNKHSKKLDHFKVYGWKVDEQNLATLPEDAPEGARLLVERGLIAARVRTLKEWTDAYNQKTGRIHGSFNPLGARTHRATHSNPNMGNIATKKSIKYNTPRLRELALDLGGTMRSMWIADKDCLLVGTDMESAHLRIFAHLIDDKEFTQSLITGKKEDGTDPHSVNKRKLGAICPDRDRAKTFIFSFLNGAAAPKVADIFGCTLREAKAALEGYVQSYPGLQRVKQDVIPRDAARGYFAGVDGRLVRCDSEHLMLGMYLQNMESVLMKHANVIWRKKLDEQGIKFRQVNWVHDEWVTEVHGTEDLCRLVGEIQSDSIREVGELFHLRCPMAGDYKIGKNWLEVH